MWASIKGMTFALLLSFLLFHSLKFIDPRVWAWFEGKAHESKTFSLGIKAFYGPNSAVTELVFYLVGLSNVKFAHSSLFFSIVFVHGLTGDREKTWTFAGTVDPWPKILLSDDIPRSRILTFGSDADVFGLASTGLRKSSR